MGEQQQHPQEEPREVGFFERRWRVAKAFVKSTVDYLFSIQTWVSAAVMVGGAAWLGTTGTGFGEWAADLFKVGKDSPPGSVMIGIGRALAFGTAFSMGVGMFKEGKICEDCNTQAAALAQALEKQQAQNQPGQQQQMDYSSYHAPQGFVPTPGIPIARADQPNHTQQV